MTKKDEDNPLEEIQKQLQQLLKGQNVQVAVAPFIKAAEAQQEESESADEPEEPSGGDRLTDFREFPASRRKSAIT